MASFQGIVSFVVEFFAGALEGRVESLVVVALIAILLLRLILADWLFTFLVRGAVLGTIGAATWFGYQHALDNFSQTVAYVALGAGGLMILASIAVMAANTREREYGPTGDREGPVVAGGAGSGGNLEAGEVFGGAGPTATPGQQQGGLLAQFRQLDPTARTNIFSTIAFMFIAEFGVFSSVTINAKDPVIGAVFFVVFHLAALLYIWTSYQEPARGLKHYAVVAVASVVVALILYYTWTVEPIPLDELVPWGFFTQSTMVASVTGVAFSLIISGKG